jgi:hypothetical protein
MQAMAWWSVPLVAFVLAIVWVSVANRPRPPADPHDSVAEHQRFREAMDRSIARPSAGSPTTPEPGGRDGVDPADPAGPTGQRA